MRIDDQLKMLCLKTDLSLSEVGRRLNKTPQAFSQKIKRGSFSLDDMIDIAMVTGCKFDCSLILPSGEKIVIE